MIRPTMEFRNERAALAAEQAIAMVRELEALDDPTPDSKVLAVVEREVVERGRRFVRDRLQDVLNAQAEGLEQKGARLAMPLRRIPQNPGHGQAASRRSRR